MSQHTAWDRFTRKYLILEETGFALDTSRMLYEDTFLEEMAAQCARAFSEMAALEKGAVANPDENRMVGHYWLREPDLAPNEAMRLEILKTRESVKTFAAEVRKGRIQRPDGAFTDALIVGIGGSALGPQFVAEALASPGGSLRLHFLDNTDPDGFDRVFAEIQQTIATTLVVVISKSGGTKETRNGMLETDLFFRANGFEMASRAVAVTGAGSELDRHATASGWLAQFPMWDWVGGRTSVMSAVGLLPMALQGLDVDAFLGGAAAMDRATRLADSAKNPAMVLALMWYHAGCGRGLKDMVVLPYRDRLLLFSKYLQQLVMESIGKEKDLDGKTVHQGIAVYGNKGSTDQHAYVQQLRDGINNFFATFIEVRHQRAADSPEVEPGVTSGDYLQGFLRGTRAALSGSGRESITLSLPDLSAFSVGALIALYERTVGFYASLIHVNAYHQPGVEAGKKAATELLALQARIIAELENRRSAPATSCEIASALGVDPESVYHLLRHLAANRPEISMTGSAVPDVARFAIV